MIWALLAVVTFLALSAAGLFGSAEDDDGLVFVAASRRGAARGDILDRNGRTVGYGVRRDDGSWSLYALDGIRLGVLPPRQEDLRIPAAVGAPRGA